MRCENLGHLVPPSEPDSPHTKPGPSRQTAPAPAPDPVDVPTLLTQARAVAPPHPQGDTQLKARLLADGARVGRFTVLRQLDKGGMGLIFVARDDELDRQIALKILRTRHAADALGRARLLREAQALARLSHPNVVTVYEVGQFDGHVFVAMELIEGRTLRAWVRQRPRTWREIVGMFVQAGRGLVAAHAANIIHRDFKPANVLVGDDGRVRVLDFGIARTPGWSFDVDLDDISLESSSVESRSVLAGDALTFVGVIAGTPPYMAPEQLVGGEIDGRADQYGFCVALAEALYGERPTRGKTIDERLKELHDRPTPDLPRTSRVPQFLRAALLRGLEPEPAKRFPTMDALLAAIDRDPIRTRLQIAAGLGLGLALLLVGVFIARRDPASACADVDVEIEGLWASERRDATRAAIEATGVHHATTTWQRLEPRLDAYATQWGARRRSTCVAHRRGERSDELHGRQLVCLQRRRSAFDALIGSLVVADAATVEKAVQATDELPELAACDDLAALVAAVAPPDDPAVAEEIERLQDQLEPARVALSLYKTREGLPIVDTIRARARELGHLPFEAEVKALAGRLHNAAGDYATGEKELTEALWIADQIGDDELLAHTMSALITTIGNNSGRLDEALRWRRHADSVRARLLPGSTSGAWLLFSLGNAHWRRGEYQEALDLLGRALETLEALHGPGDARLAKILNSLGVVQFRKGDLEAARALFERGLALNEAALGPEHPDLATPLSNLGAVTGASGDFAGSLVYLRRALAIKEATLGAEHPELNSTLDNICATFGNMGDLAAARGYCERSLAILERVHGPDHLELVNTLDNLGMLALNLGDRPAARAYFGRALKIQEKALPADHPQLASVLVNLGSAEIESRRPRAAIPHLERALAIFTARTDVNDVEHLATARYHLANALITLGRDPGRQRSLAEAALAGFRELAPRFTDERAALERFLAEPAGKARKKKPKKTAKKKPKKKAKKKPTK
jgi:tetratricopeptide (TPR) repeat protein/tRNA A-37 threonylcarbamoyl transferase component Bud32